MEEKFVLEIGYGLLPLVDKSNHELLDDISYLRKKKLHCPKIHIRDNMTLEPYEISLNQERHVLDDNENLSSQICTLIEQYVNEHLEIQEMQEVFKTGESLSFIFARPEKKDFKVNLMLPEYPTFWNRSYSLNGRPVISNCDYSLYITEISEASSGIYKVELINTEIVEDNNRYYLAGRFKFYLKKGDTLDFLYYDEKDDKGKYRVQAKVEDLSYNKMELSFDKVITIPEPFCEENSNIRCSWL